MGNAATVNISKSAERKFTEEFRKSFFTDLDTRFLAIVFICVFIEGVIVFILAGRPIPQYTDRDIARIQERFANFILDEDVNGRRANSNIASTIGTTVAGEEIAAEEAGEAQGAGGNEGEAGAGGAGEGEGTGSGEGPGEGGSGEIRRPTRMEAAEARRRTREAISEQVSNRGLLGLLTGTGTAAEGEAVVSVFTPSGSGGGVDKDLDDVLSSVNGLQTKGSLGAGGGGGGEGSGSGGGGGGARGSRSGRRAGIDDLVTQSSTVQSESLSRKGELIVEAPEEVAGTGRKSVYRSPEAIQEVLLSHNAAIRYCYERELKRNPSLKGKLSVRITVSPNGSVKAATIVSSTLNSERVERCILARIQRWNDFQPIDAAEGDVTFRQVYTFGY